MGAPLIKGGGPSRKRKRKNRGALTIWEKASQKERKVFPTRPHPHTNQNSSLFPHIFPISSTPHHKKLLLIIIIIKESLKLSPICTAHTH
jgi:hypothetical protein